MVETTPPRKGPTPAEPPARPRRAPTIAGGLDPARLQAAADHARLTDILSALEWATEDFVDQAKGNPALLAYLADERGFPDPLGLIARYDLGYAKGHGLAERLTKRGGFPLTADVFTAALLNADVLKIRQSDGKPPVVSETFWKRLMFPIRWDARDSQNKLKLDQVVGFGGRVLGEGDPKYINSRATSVFHKKQTMYGLPRARAAIQASARVQIVEGNFDAIRMQEHGFLNTVAGLGTAVGVEQYAALAAAVGLAPTDIEWIFCLDLDQAGQKALTRALDDAWVAGLRTSVAIIEGGKDADVAIREHGADVVNAALAKRVTGSRPVLAKRGLTEDGYGRLRDVIRATRTLTQRGASWSESSRAAVVADFDRDLAAHGFTPNAGVLTRLSEHGMVTP